MMRAKNQEFLLTFLILSLIYILAFSTRLFSVLRFESVIHEFDPYFNFRTTKYLVNEGFYNFINWFDQMSWYPLGRIVGGTVYPGLMLTAGFVHYVLHFFNVTIDIRNVCVLLAPWFSSNTAIATYFFTKEIDDNKASGLLAAALMGIVPGYISRSVAGSYDNEGIAIFALIFTFYLWTKSVKTGSLFWSALCALSYFYMVSAWGGYVFIINLIPLHALALLFTGRFSNRLYVAYCTVYVMGTILAMQISFVGFAHVQSSETLAAMVTFVIMQIYVFSRWVKRLIGEKMIKSIIRVVLPLAISIAIGFFLFEYSRGAISPFTGRFYSLIDPTYAKKYIPIIASVSEHQPTLWISFFFDLHILTFLFIAGLYYCFKEANDAKLFAAIYGVGAIYFSGVMVRLMLVLAPIACVLSAIALSRALSKYMKFVKKNPTKSVKKSHPLQRELGIPVIILVGALLIWFTFHSTWVTSEAYSSPSIVLAAKQSDGHRLIFDDFREAYWWLRMNTPQDAKIMSWWDYGYQITGMANRTVLVDNNTWNNTHISQVGQAMASNETVAYEIMQKLDVDYVLVIFGGLIGYSSDDINKFLWMVRIGGSTNSKIREEDYYNSKGEYKIDSTASKTMLNCLMYKLSYYRFGEVYTQRGSGGGYDRVRGAEIGNKNIKLDHLDEAYTSEHWIVRIYKVKKPNNRHPEITKRNFDKKKK